MAKKFNPNIPIYQIKITLLDTKPPIWRRFHIRENITLYGLHDYLQGIMGWHDCHLHEFLIDGERYGISNPEYRFEGMDVKDEKKHKVCQVATEGDIFEYVYDFGDNWTHRLEVEDVLTPETNTKYPICIEGERACPPEDCGGVWGYEELLEIIADPDHEQYEEMMDWLGGDYNPDEFNLKRVNDILDNIRSNKRRSG